MHWNLIKADFLSTTRSPLIRYANLLTEAVEQGLVLIFIELNILYLTLSTPIAGQKEKADTSVKEDFKCPGEAGTGSFADPQTCRRFYQVS